MKRNVQGNVFPSFPQTWQVPQIDIYGDSKTAGVIEHGNHTFWEVTSKGYRGFTLPGAVMEPQLLQDHR